MKKRLITVCLFVFLSEFSAASAVLEEGRCYIDAPAIYSETKDNIVAHLCQVVKNGEFYVVQFLARDGWIELEVLESGKVKIIDNFTSSSEARGTGTLNANGYINGEVTVVSWAWGVIPSRRKSEWFLRPATESEIRMGIVNGLKSALGSAPIKDKKKFMNATLPDIEINHYLNVGTRGGYPESDIPIIRKMIQEGELVFDEDSGFIFSKPLSNPEVKTDPQLEPFIKLSADDLKPKVPKLSPKEQKALRKRVEANQNAATREFDELQAKRIAETQGLKQVDPEKKSNPPLERKFDPWLWGPVIVFVLLVISLALSFRRKQRS